MEPKICQHNRTCCCAWQLYHIPGKHSSCSRFSLPAGKDMFQSIPYSMWNAKKGNENLIFKLFYVLITKTA